MVHDSLNHLSFFNNSRSPRTFNSVQVTKNVSSRHSEALKKPLEAIKGLDLNVEICGAWIWVFGADGSHEEPLKTAGFNWSFKRGAWYFCPQEPYKAPSSQKSDRPTWPMDKIREKYGSEAVYNENRQGPKI